MPYLSMKPTKIDPAFIRIDNALSQYYQDLGNSNYRNQNGNGIFLQYVIDEELTDPDLSIENELGINCDPTDCAYSWMSNETEFPLPYYAKINGTENKDKFIFYILQYCYQHGQRPSDDYIKSTIVPACDGHNDAKLPNPVNNTNLICCGINGNKSQSHKPSLPPPEAEQLYHEQSPHERPAAAPIPGLKDVVVDRLYDEPFIPKYPARAHLNIFTAKELTKNLREIIQEPFKNELLLYYYTDISTALQINDKQMRIFHIIYGDRALKLSIINYDLHLDPTGDVLYGIITPNDNYKIQQDKWLWKLDEFITADGVAQKYKILHHELPKSSRQMPSFQRQLQQKLVIEETMMAETDWFNVQQIKSLKRNVKVPKVSILLSKEMWIAECKKSLMNIESPLIPVVVNKNNKHWIEWVKIVNIESQGVYVGISCKYDDDKYKWCVQSICLDRGDIYNKHRLVGLKESRFEKQLKEFKTSITEIKFSDNDGKDIDKKLTELKKQIKNQQESIVRLKEQLLRVKNASVDDGSGNEMKAAAEEENKSMSQHIEAFINEPQEEMIGGDAWLDQIVDDVIKTYDVLDFKTTPIGAKRNIYVDKSFTKAWMNHVSPRFNDDAMMYYWLDYTTAMQMCQGYSKQYVNKETRKFMLAIINYELRDLNNNVLYGIIVCDDEKIEKKNDKYPYKLKTLMTKEQIRSEYGINPYDLPRKSRKNQDFTDKLILKRKISKQDLTRINWSNLKLFKSRSTNNDPLNQSLTITEKVMKKYCQIAWERLNNDNDNGKGNHLIPVVIIDKHHNCYWIEWVLIVHIIHRNFDVGISFRFDEKTKNFMATAIYLDKGEIEWKHKLIGLKFDYCKHLQPFSLRKFKFQGMYRCIMKEDGEMVLSQIELDIIAAELNEIQIENVNILNQINGWQNEPDPYMQIYGFPGFAHKKVMKNE